MATTSRSSPRHPPTHRQERNSNGCGAVECKYNRSSTAGASGERIRSKPDPMTLKGKAVKEGRRRKADRDRERYSNWPLGYRENKLALAPNTKPSHARVHRNSTTPSRSSGSCVSHQVAHLAVVRCLFDYFRRHPKWRPNERAFLVQCARQLTGDPKIGELHIALFR